MKQKINPKYKFFNTQDALKKYGEAVTKIGIWQSEAILIRKYAHKNSRILDVGCGAGRTTIALYELGYQNIIGIDIADILINEAMQYSRNRGLFIDFRNMDASKLLFENSTFDLAFFSYNGLTGIPTQKRRLDVMNEIYRTLKLGGYFIFTAHDRNSESTNITFWKNERERWKKGKNNPVLYEYGDMLVKNGEAQEFLHYYSREEMEKLILQTQFKIVEVKMRSEIAKESEKVKSFSKETCFWVLKK